MNKKSVIFLAVVAVILHFTPFFPNVAFYSRLLGDAFGYALDTSVWITYLSIIGPLLFGAFMFDELVKSRPEAMFANYHEGHEEHEVEIIIYFFVSSCSSCPSW